MSIVGVGLDLETAVWRDLHVDATLHAAREPGFAERFEHAAQMGVRQRVLFRAAVLVARRVRGSEAVPVWSPDEVLREARERVVVLGRGF